MCVIVQCSAVYVCLFVCSAVCVCAVRVCMCACVRSSACVMCARARVCVIVQRSAEQWSVFVCSAVCVCLCVYGVVCAYIHLNVYCLLILMSIEATGNMRMYFPTQL